MPSHGLRTAVTLYRTDTLSLEQAASRAGLSAEAFADQLAKYGVEVEPEAAPDSAGRATAD